MDAASWFKSSVVLGFYIQFKGLLHHYQRKSVVISGHYRQEQKSFCKDLRLHSNGFQKNVFGCVNTWIEMKLKCFCLCKKERLLSGTWSFTSWRVFEVTYLIFSVRPYQFKGSIINKNSNILLLCFLVLNFHLQSKKLLVAIEWHETHCMMSWLPYLSCARFFFVPVKSFSFYRC